MLSPESSPKKDLNRLLTLIRKAETDVENSGTGHWKLASTDGVVPVGGSLLPLDCRPHATFVSAGMDTSFTLSPTQSPSLQ